MKKKFLLLALLGLAVTSAFSGIYTPQTVPNPKLKGQDYYVSNPDGILSQATVDSLNHLAMSLDREFGVEMAIVVLGSFRLNEEETPNECDLFEFNYELFNLWGIGDAETNRGLLITVSYDAHQMFISTGSSLDADLPDATCHYIQNAFMLPHFREGDYDEGVIGGVVVIYGYLADEGVRSTIDEAAENPEETDPVKVFLGIAVIVGYIYLRRKLRGFGGGYGGGYSGGRSWGGGYSGSHSSGGSWGGGRTSGGGAGSRW